MNAAKRVWRRRAMRKGADGGLPGGEHIVGTSPAPRVRFGLLGKITVFLVLVLVPLAAVSWTVAYRSLQDNLTLEFTDKGSAIANSLASSGADLIVNRDASTVQAQVDEFAKITGVAYVMVYDPQRGFIAHTFGTVRVGMDKSIITASAVQAGNFLLLVFGGIAVAAGLAGVIFAQRITRPVNALMAGAERVGRGDLSQLVPVTSRDEIGQMAITFNESIVRLRALVQTEADRDEERRKREDLQQNIIKFLDTVVEIGKGDLSRRGEVTWDVLGNVVDAINLMVEEIATVVGDVREAALRVTAGSQDTIK